MDNIDFKLNNLPRKKLPRRVDWAIKSKLYFLMLQKKLALFSRQENFSPALLRPMMAAIIILLSVIIVPAYAYANDNITRGNWLYPVKRAVENIEMNLPASLPRQVATYEKMAARRLSEAEFLAAQNGLAQPDEIETAINDAVGLKAKAAAKSKEAENQKASDRVADIINESTERQAEKLAKIALHVGINSNEELVDTIAIALDDVKTKKQDFKFVNNFPKADEVLIATTSDSGLEFIEDTTGKQTATSVQSRPVHDPVSSSSNRNEKFRKATSTAKIITRDEAEEAISGVKRSIDSLKDSLSVESFPEQDVRKLIDRLNNKLDRSYQAMELNDFDKLNGLLNSTWALTNNAKHFMKKNETNGDTANPFNQEQDNNREGEKNNSGRSNRK